MSDLAQHSTNRTASDPDPSLHAAAWWARANPDLGYGGGSGGQEEESPDPDTDMPVPPPDVAENNGR